MICYLRRSIPLSIVKERLPLVWGGNGFQHQVGFRVGRYFEPSGGIISVQESKTIQRSFKIKESIMYGFDTKRAVFCSPERGN